MPPIKILMLHGYTQSGASFHAKTKALEKALQKALAPAGGVELIYPTAPLRLRLADLPGASSAPSDEGGDRNLPTTDAGADPDAATDFYAWWRRDDASQRYIGLESANWPLLRDLLTTHARSGVPIAGTIGFSQGAALAAIVASILSRPPHIRIPPEWRPLPPHPPLRFALCYSGFRAPHAQYDFLYEPKIATAVLHFVGSLDTVVEEARTLGLIHACADERVVHHPGGHYLPGGKMFVGAAVAFVVERCADIIKARQSSKEEQSAEDMDVPF